MRIEGTYTFPAPLDRVFTALAEPDVLAKAIPGCERLAQMGPARDDGAITLEVRLRAGAGSAVYLTTAELAALRQPAQVRVDLHGLGPAGPITAHGTLHLTERDDQTEGRYQWEIEASGLREEQQDALSNGTGQRLAQSFCERITVALRERASLNAARLSGVNLNGHSTGILRARTPRGQIIALPREAEPPAERDAPGLPREAVWMTAGLVVGLGALALTLSFARRLRTRK
jgi:carbon monoxide dehydrogenase subunit G